MGYYGIYSNPEITAEDEYIEDETKWVLRPGETIGLWTVDSKPFYRFMKKLKDRQRLQAVVAKCVCGTRRALFASQMKCQKSFSCGRCEEALLRRNRKGTLLNEQGEKVCSTCRATLAAGNFSNDKRNRDGLSNNCLRCAANSSLKRRYGMTIDDYDKMLMEQEGKCACCQTTSPHKLNDKYLRFLVDHCHKTGQVRGLLCHHCNLMLGLAKDEPETLSNASRYLERFYNTVGKEELN